jgi:hypothetical protein
VSELRWRHDHEQRPAWVYRAEKFMIIYDPAGPADGLLGPRGGWYLYRAGKRLGILPSLAEAKKLAEARR